MNSNSLGSGHPPPLRASGEGISQVDPSAHLPDVQETSSWRFSYDNKVPIFEIPESFDLIWRKIREKGCELPSLSLLWMTCVGMMLMFGWRSRVLR